MPKPTKKKPAITKRIVELHKEGASTREIGDALDIAHTTIAKWLKDMRLTPNGGHGGRKTRKRSKPSDPTQTAAGIAAELEADLETGFSGLDVLRQRLSVLRKAIKDAHPAFIRGELGSTQYEKLITLERVLARELAEAEAASKSKGGSGSDGNDPFTREAAANVTAKLRALIEEAESGR